MKHRLFLVLASGLWVLTSCIDSTSTIRVEEDGSGTIELTRTLETNFLDNYISDNGTTLSPGDQDIERICSQMAEEANYPEGTKIEPVESPSTCGVTLTLEVPAGGDFGGQLAEIEQSAFGPLSDLFTPPNDDDYVIEERDDQWIFKMPAPSVQNLDTDYISEGDAESVLASANFSYEVSLPGTSIADETNADNVVGGTFMWSIDPTNGPGLLEARTSPPSKKFWQRISLPVIALAAFAIAGLIFFVFTKVRRRRSFETDSGDEKTATHSSDPDLESVEDETSPTTELRSQSAASDDTETIMDPAPTMATLPLGSSSPEWNEDLQMWLSSHEVKGRLFFDDSTQRWETLR